MDGTGPAAGARIEPLAHEVAYADTDAGGIVYHARYIEMAERSRNAVLRALDLPVAGMRARFGVLFIIREARALYHQPALVGDLLALASGIVSAGPVRVTWRTRITRDDQPICDVEVQIAAFDPAQGGPCPLPEALMRRLADAPRLAPAPQPAAMRPAS